MYTIIWESDQGRNWQQLPLEETLDLLDNLGAYGVDSLLVFPPDAKTMQVEDLESLYNTVKEA